MAVLSDSQTPDFYYSSLSLPEHQYRVIEALLIIGLLSRTYEPPVVDEPVDLWLQRR